MKANALTITTNVKDKMKKSLSSLHVKAFTLASILAFSATIHGHALAQDALADTLPPAPFVPSVAAAPKAVTTLPSSLPSSPPLSSGAPAVFVPVAPTSGVAVPAPGMPNQMGGEMGGGIINGGSTNNNLMRPAQTPKIVQDAVTGLQKTDPINLDDMIRAQDAINRLDLLLEIEKRQSELKKIRDESNKPAASSLLGNSIPASALNLPAASSRPAPSAPSSEPSPPPAPKKVTPPPASEPSEKYSIRRIIGSSGQYMALINTGEDRPQTIKAGDKLSDGSIVKSIGLTNVVLTKDKKSKILAIPTDSYIVRESEQ